MTEENKIQLEGCNRSYTETAAVNVLANYTEKPQCPSYPKKAPEHVQSHIIRRIIKRKFSMGRFTSLENIQAASF